MYSKLRFSALILVTLATGCGQPGNTISSDTKEAWSSAHDPLQLYHQYQRRLEVLPPGGEVAKKPWTDNYWPNKKAGIAYRWLDGNHATGFDYGLHDRWTVENMSDHQRALLSPAEKYDIYQGRFDYPTVWAERNRTRASDPEWYGLCHGLAPASQHFDEPKPVYLTGPGGIPISFGSSDIKALLIAAQSKVSKLYFAGQRCNADLSKEPWKSKDPECRGINAGSFHVVLSNFVGLMQQTLIADISRGHEVWNHPIFSFESEQYWESYDIYPGAAPGTSKIVAVRTRIQYIRSTFSGWEPANFSSSQVGAENYDYILELNRNGEIIGGEWKSENRPGFLWRQNQLEFRDYNAQLFDIYQASR